MPSPSWGSDRRDVSPPRDDSTPTRECPQTSPTFGPGKGPHPLTAFAKPVLPRTNSTVSWPTTTGSEAPSGDKDAELGVASPNFPSKRAGPRMGKLAKPTMLRSLTAMSWTSTQKENQDDSPHREEPALKKSASRISFSSWRSGSSGGSGKKKQQQKPAAPGDSPNYVEDEGLLEGERRVRFRPSAIVSEPQAVHEPQGGNPNKIRTARFTMLTWLPLSLFHQFQRVANVYFLCIVVLVMFPWSPKDWKSKVFPFSLVLFWTACKDLHEDARRRRDDALENNQKTTAFDIDKKKFVEKDWQDILVGDVILVECDKAFPADLILLYAGGSHEAFISTITLDGETNLKERVPPAICESFAVEATDTPGPISKKFKIAKVADTAMKVMHEMHTQFFTCKVGKPEVAVQDVKGTLQANTMSEACPISFSNFLPRGCVLRNTGWILALVVYVGDETKTRLNTAQSRNKVSNMQKYLNQCVWGLLGGLFIVCFYAATARVAIEGDFSPCCDEESWLIRFCVFMITFYHVVPMSLYVVFEMLKLLLGWQVNTDPQMKDPHTGELAVARTADLIEEMGQINFAFSDKTGTLTKNEMVFARACVGGKDLGDFRSAERGVVPESVVKVRDNLAAPSLDSYWTDVHWFFTCLATCHSVQVSFTEKEDHAEKSVATSPGLIEKSKGLESLGSSGTGTEGRRYLGMSPDEVCLVEVAQQVGIAFTNRMRPPGKGSYASEVSLQLRDGSTKVFSILYELEFNSDRKRMSVIMRAGDEVYLVTKGADIVMEPLLTENLPTEYLDCLKQYSQSGLRTLVIAYKKIDRQYLKSWEKDYKHALNLLDSTKDAQIAQVSARIEHGLTLLGITGVEDCLQDGVPKAIATLKECGVRVWVLTGDKTETAVDIARSCMLFVDQTTLAYGTEASDVEDALRRLQEARKTLEGRSDAGLVLDGRTLQYALQSEECRQLIFELGIASRSCVCCRLTPLQKRQLVELVRQKDPSTITLAVGDGANDVPMIEGAHLGIAIRGKEGAQAVQVSDVAISQFRFLVPLLLCHGRRAYRRIAIYLCYYLYKNVVLAMGDVVWMHMDEYRGRIAFPEWVSINYNVFFTSWHILFLLGFDQDVPDEVANTHPEIYLVGPKRALFNKLIFSRWMIFAVYHGIVAWVVPYYMISVDEVYDKERPNGWWEGSITSFTIIVFIVLLKLLLSTQSPFRLVTSILPTVASLVCYFMGLGIIGYMPMFTNPKPEGLQPNMKEIPGDTFGNSKALIAIAVVPTVVFISDLIFEMTLKTVWPTPLDKVKAKVLHGES